MGHPPKGTVLDRKDPFGNYSCGECEQCIANKWPMNCRWVDYKTSGRNKRARVGITINGVTKTMYEWADLSGIPYSTIQTRYLRGKDPSTFLNPNHLRFGTPLQQH
jgi:hypothetical protein